jgi:hypothetical protein
MVTTATQAQTLVPAELKDLTPRMAQSFEELYKFAQICHASGMFEDVTDVAQAFVKICRGAEMGIPPTTAMHGFDIIKKRLFVKPWLIAAKINACGYGGYIVEEQTAERCTIRFRRRYPERGWVDLPLMTYTIAEAKGHGLVQRSPHWQTSPANMLYQRCMGRGGTTYFPELLAGLEAPPEPMPPEAEPLRSNVVALYGEPLDPTAPSARVPVSPPVPVPPPVVEPQAGHDTFEYIARIEAAIFAHHGQVEPWYVWAERRFKKARTQFSVAEWQEFLECVQAVAQKMAQQTPQEALGGTTPAAEGQSQAAPQDAPTDAAEAAEATAEPGLFGPAPEAGDYYGDAE